jgi:hypothetical protein
MKRATPTRMRRERGRAAGARAGTARTRRRMTRVGAWQRASEAAAESLPRGEEERGAVPALTTAGSGAAAAPPRLPAPTWKVRRRMRRRAAADETRGSVRL